MQRLAMAEPPRTVLPGRLRRRLTIAFVLVAGVAAGALAIGSFLLVQRARLQDSLQRAEADVRFQLVVAEQFIPLNAERRSALLASFEQTGHHVVLSEGGATTSSNSAFDPHPSASLHAIAASGQIGYERVHIGDHALLVVGGRIPNSRDQLYFVSSDDRIEADLNDLRNVLLAGWAAVVVFAALVGRILARRTLEPVGRASEAARSVAEGLLDTRLPAGRGDEFGAWAASFNQMAAALEAKVDALSEAQARERRFTANVAHELRTPVTALVAAASLLGEQLDEIPDGPRRPAEILVHDVVRLRRLVDDLMEISRLDARQEAVQTQPVELTALLDAVVRSRAWADRVVVEGAAVTLDTDPRRLERVIGNLISNAVEHGGGDVMVTVYDDDAVRVRVTDSGPGIDPVHLPHLFDRFYKADSARSGAGSGLGLAIARENALLLGGDVVVRSEAGAGTEFELRLPVTRPLRGSEAGAVERADSEDLHRTEGSPP
jgi:signal transduction histidine kinase